ncbi:MAG TPA: YihY/virulence factor BrkB family protein [Acidobacteriaceae bacterium]
MVTTEELQPAASGEAKASLPPPHPPAVRSARQGWGAMAVSLARYLGQTEVHTYAFSVAANAILSLFPFIVMLYTIARGVFHSDGMVNAITAMLHDLLPATARDQIFVVRNMTLLVHPRGSVQAWSVVMLLITSSGVFLPLEVALNQVWGVKKNRSYLMNQVVSLGLALGVGLLALLAVTVATAQAGILSFVFFHHTDNMVFAGLNGTFLQIAVAFLSVSMFFLVYWILPNRRLPIRAVLPAAIFTGLVWDLGRMVYIAVLPRLDLHSVYGPFELSVSLMLWAFLTGLLLLAGGQYSATRHALRLAREADAKSAREQAAIPVSRPVAGENA